MSTHFCTLYISGKSIENSKKNPLFKCEMMDNEFSMIKPFSLLVYTKLISPFLRHATCKCIFIVDFYLTLRQHNYTISKLLCFLFEFILLAIKF